MEKTPKNPMALKSTIYKANLSIADIDHSYYEDHQLTLARHPSETDERMMIRLLALAINAYKLQAVCNGDGKLAFGAGLSDPDDPDCSLRDFTGQTRMWIEVGQPEDKPIMKACQKAARTTAKADWKTRLLSAPMRWTASLQCVQWGKSGCNSLLHAAKTGSKLLPVFI